MIIKYVITKQILTKSKLLNRLTSMIKYTFIKIIFDELIFNIWTYVYRKKTESDKKEN